MSLIENIVEVYREPSTLSNGVPDYCKRVDYEIGKAISPEIFPDMKIETSDLVNL